MQNLMTELKMKIEHLEVSCNIKLPFWHMAYAYWKYGAHILFGAKFDTKEIAEYIVSKAKFTVHGF